MAVTPIVTNPWSPAGTTNGWWPQLSPDGRYVAYGNDDLWIADLTTGTEHHIGAYRPAGWYSATVCYVFDATTGELFAVTAGTWTAVSLGIDVSLTAGNAVAAVTGHWGSWLAGVNRVVRDGVLLRAGDAFGLAMAGDYLVTRRTSDWAFQVYEAGSFVRTVTPAIEANFFSVSAAGWVAYAGAQGIYAAPPTGGPHHRLVSGANEGLGPLVARGTTTWLWTGYFPDGATYAARARNVALTDPAAALSAAIDGPLYLSVVSVDAGWIVAGTTDTGVLTVIFALPGATAVGTTSIPTDLGANDVGFLLGVLDFGHLLRWNGSAWDWAPGDGGNGYVVTGPTIPAPVGWIACTGQTTTQLQVGRRVTARTVRTPVIADVTAGTVTLKAWYRR